MRVIHCEQCGTPLPWSAQFCAICSTAVSLHPFISDYADAPGHSAQRPRTDALQTSSFCKMGSDDPDETQRLDHAQVRANSALLAAEPTFDVAAASPEGIEDWLEAEEMDGETLHCNTWQKFVTRKPLAVPVGSVSAVASFAPVAPREPVLPAPPPYKIRAELAPTLALAPPPPDKRQPPRSSLMPRVAGWVAMSIIVALVLGGGFGVFVSLAHAPTGPLSLQVTPSSIAFGGIVTLRGSHFTPRGRIGLTRDASLPLVDTGGSSFTVSDASGSFSDTVSIDGSWTDGTHTIHAEDVHSHQTASFPVLVIGQSTSWRPVHLALSVNSIDFGSGDQATNSAQTITLSNAGGSEIDWRSTVTQPWLLLSPQNGSLAVGQQMQVTLAADRSSLQVGSYSASVSFTSNSGSIPLPVKIQVTPLQPVHALIMQVTPAVLSFSGTGGSGSPGPQAVTISTPGVLPLQWNAASATNDGSNWLSVFPPSGTVAKGDAQSVTVSVDNSQLLPGVYYGSIIFSIQGSPVAITVQVTHTQGATGTGTTTIPVNNAPPSVGTITGVSSTVKVKTSITASAHFTDPGVPGTHTAQWNWGDGNATTGTVTESNASGSVTNSHTYTALGAYTITLTVTDDHGGSGTSHTIVAIIPPNGLAGRNLSGLNYSGADLSNQNLSGSNLQNATFTNTNFPNANLSGVNAPNASFQHANFTGANLAGSAFQGANFTNANLSGANLKGANFKDAIVTGVTWSNTICPDGTNSNTDKNTCTGHGGGL